LSGAAYWTVAARRSLGQSSGGDRACRRSGVGTGCLYRPHGPLQPAGGDPRGLCTYRPRQRTEPPPGDHVPRLAQRITPSHYFIRHSPRICPCRIDPGRARLWDTWPWLCDVYRGERTRCLCDAEPGLPLLGCFRAAEHPGGPYYRLVGPEDPLPMTATEPDAAYPFVQTAPADQTSLLRRVRGGLRTFVRRAPLSAFWGCIAAA